MERFQKAWISGSTNYRPSNAVDHAKGKPHKAAMKMFMREQGKGVEEERSANQTSIVAGLAAMSNEDKARTEKKFQVAYFVGKEELPMSKFSKIMDLEELHSVQLGNAYRNDNQCGTFIDFIGDDLANNALSKMQGVKFYSVLWDGATDVSVAEKETIFVKYLDTISNEDGVFVKTKFLGMHNVSHAHADGIVESIDNGFKNIGN